MSLATLIYFNHRSLSLTQDEPHDGDQLALWQLRVETLDHEVSSAKEDCTSSEKLAQQAHYALVVCEVACNLHLKRVVRVDSDLGRIANRFHWSRHCAVKWCVDVREKVERMMLSGGGGGGDGREGHVRRTGSEETRPSSRFRGGDLAAQRSKQQQ